MNKINKSNNNLITLYFKTIDGKEVYLEVKFDELFSNVIQLLANRYNNPNFTNAIYFVGTMDGRRFIEFNKTVYENNLSNNSNIIVDFINN